MAWYWDPPDTSYVELVGDGLAGEQEGVRGGDVRIIRSFMGLKLGSEADPRGMVMGDTLPPDECGQVSYEDVCIWIYALIKGELTSREVPTIFEASCWQARQALNEEGTAHR